MKNRLAGLVLALRCVLRWLLHGAAKKKVTPQSIVIVQFGKLGDMVCTTPMFRAIKKHDPSTRVIVVGDRVGGEVLAGSKDVDRYIVCGTDIAEALQELKKEKPEAGINVGPSVRGFALLYLAGIKTIVTPQVIGEKSSEGKLYAWLRSLAIVVPHRMGHYAPGEYLRTLEPIGIQADDTTKYVFYTKEAETKVTQFLQEHGGAGQKLVGIAPSAGNKLKNWPAERFAAVCAHVVNLGYIPVLIGGPGDTQETEEVLAHIPTGLKVIHTVGVFSLEELKALIAKLSLFVSTDTGPIYIAEALGIPTIDIVGPMDENEQPPRGPRNLVVIPPFPRVPELSIMSRGHYNVAEARRQVEGITAQQVIEAIDLLSASSKCEQL